MNPDSIPSEPETIGITRRDAIAFLGAAGIASLTGCVTQLGGNQSTSNDNSNANSAANMNTNGGSGTPNCVVTPELTEGPYFVDELLNRSDIRIDPSDGSTQEGALLNLTFNVSRVDGDVCTPLSGATVDIWHCNAEGLYSDVAENNTVGSMFLRGYQVTDANGAAQFTTIFPGWYSGRSVHIHFKVRTSEVEFNSQLFFSDSDTQQILATGVYSARGQAETTNAEDNIYTADTLVSLTQDGAGYRANFDIGLTLS